MTSGGSEGSLDLLDLLASGNIDFDVVKVDDSDDGGGATEAIAAPSSGKASPAVSEQNSRHSRRNSRQRRRSACLMPPADESPRPPPIGSEGRDASPHISDLQNDLPTSSQVEGAAEDHEQRSPDVCSEPHTTATPQIGADPGRIAVDVAFDEILSPIGTRCNEQLLVSPVTPQSNVRPAGSADSSSVRGQVPIEVSHTVPEKRSPGYSEYGRSFESMITTMSLTNESARARITELERRLDERSASLTQAQEQIQAANFRIRQLDAELRTERTHPEQSKEIESLTSSLAEARARAIEAEGRAANAEGERDEVVSQMTEEKTRLQAQLDIKVAELEKATERIASLEAFQTEAGDNRARLGNELESLRCELDKARTDAMAKEQQLQEKLSAVTEQENQAREQLTTLRAQQQESERLAQERAHELDELRDALTRLKEDHVSATELLRSNEIAARESEVHLSEHTEKIAELQTLLDERNAEQAELRRSAEQQHSADQAAIANLNAQLAELQQNHQNSEQQAQNLRRQVSDLQSQCESLQSERDSVLERCRTAEDSARERLQTAQALATRAEEAQRDASSLAETITSLKAELQQERQRADSAEIHLTAASGRLEGLNATQQEQQRLTHQVISLQAELKQSSTLFEQVQASADQRLQQLNEATATLKQNQTEIMNLRGNNRALEEELRELRETLGQVDDARMKADQLDDELTRLKQDYESALQQCAAAEERAASSSRARESYDRARQEAEAKRREAEAALKEAEIEKSRLDSQLRVTQEQLQQAKASESMALTQLDEEVKNVSEFRAENWRLREELQRQEMKLTPVDGKRVQDLYMELSQLKGQLKSMEKARDRAETRAKALEENYRSRLEQQNTEVDGLRDQIRTWRNRALAAERSSEELAISQTQAQHSLRALEDQLQQTQKLAEDAQRFAQTQVLPESDSSELREKLKAAEDKLNAIVSSVSQVCSECGLSPIRASTSGPAGVTLAFRALLESRNEIRCRFMELQQQNEEIRCQLAEITADRDVYKSYVADRKSNSPTPSPAPAVPPALPAVPDVRNEELLRAKEEAKEATRRYDEYKSQAEAEIARLNELLAQEQARTAEAVEARESAELALTHEREAIVASINKLEVTAERIGSPELLATASLARRSSRSNSASDRVAALEAVMERHTSSTVPRPLPNVPLSPKTAPPLSPPCMERAIISTEQTKLEQEVERLQREKQELEQERDTLIREKEQLIGERDEARADASLAQAMHASNETTVCSLRKELEEARASPSISPKRRTQLASPSVCIPISAPPPRAVTAPNKSDSTPGQAARVLELEARANKLQAELARVRAGARADRDTSREQIERLQRSLAQARSAPQRNSDRVVEQLSTQLASTRRDLEIERQRNATARSELETLRARVAQMKRAPSRLPSTSKIMQDSQIVDAKLREEFQTMLSRLIEISATGREIQQDDITRLESVFLRVQQQRQRFMAERRRWDSELQASNRRLNDQQRQSAQLEQSALVSRLLPEQRKKIDDVGRQLANYQSESARLVSELAQARDLLARSQRTAADAEFRESEARNALQVAMNENAELRRLIGATNSDAVPRAIANQLQEQLDRVMRDCLKYRQAVEHNADQTISVISQQNSSLRQTMEMMRRRITVLLQGKQEGWLNSIDALLATPMPPTSVTVTDTPAFLQRNASPAYEGEADVGRHMRQDLAASPTRGPILQSSARRAPHRTPTPRDSASTRTPSYSAAASGSEPDEVCGTAIDFDSLGIQTPIDDASTVNADSEQSGDAREIGSSVAAEEPLPVLPTIPESPAAFTREQESEPPANTAIPPLTPIQEAPRSPRVITQPLHGPEASPAPMVAMQITQKPDSTPPASRPPSQPQVTPVVTLPAQTAADDVFSPASGLSALDDLLNSAESHTKTPNQWQGIGLSDSDGIDLLEQLGGEVGLSPW